ncbi:DsbA family protein [Dongshaea marina]|uniref:DsbA family protein n=1 Tax=Dongshaea marina TaxID=2047966 RepID=UPI000D3E7F71|nr:DsbA family protein [Dongshaea marina]
MDVMSRLIYVHDPMCSWCWGHRPEWDKLQSALAGQLRIDYCVGGLAPDSDQPMPDELRQTIRGYWQKIHELLGTEFNFDFWTENTPRRSTYPACRATLAARSQDAEPEMIDALQRAYYLRALNPSDTQTHLKLAAELGLDLARFEKELTSDALNKRMLREIKLAHSLPIRGFPSMVLLHQGKSHPIELNYQDHSGALQQIQSLLQPG